MILFSLIDEIGIYSTVCCHHHNPNDLCKAKFDSGGFDKVYIDMVRAFICECILNSLSWVFTME